ncbi:MAG: hypothetical protein B6D63_01860 [Candidatus Latescibacteria bacterium 4484_7]|nr:MAG: hypothetical protein B6D63_01860 [Candidatus Latescibacteria bacterium 4484_7]RKZ08545.1 MAG: hypothetical protein DRQ05_01275 [bacterium]
MLIFISSVLSKFVLFLLSVFMLSSPFNYSLHVRDKGSGDLAAVGISEEDSLRSARAKKSLKISISNKGIKVKSGEEGNLILKIESSEDSTGSIQGATIDSMAINVKSKNEYSIKGSDIVRFGNDIFIGKDELVQGSAVAIGGNIKIEGKVLGDVVAIGGNVDLSSTAVVNGEVVTVFGELNRADGSVVRGEIAQVGGPAIRGVIFPIKGPFEHSLGFGFLRAGTRIVVFIIMTLVFLVVLFFLSDRMNRSSRVASLSFLKSLGVGFLVLVGGAIVVFILAIIIGITIVGIPISILLVMSFFGLVLLGHFVGALAVGEFVSDKFNLHIESIYIKGILGLFILYVFGILAGFMLGNPLFITLRVVFELIGALLGFFATLVGLGAFIISKAGSIEQEAKAHLPE